MSGGEPCGESFGAAHRFSNRLVFLLKFLLGKRWPGSEVETTEEEDIHTHHSHVGSPCVCNGSREPFSPAAPHVSLDQMQPASVWKEFCSNKERHNRDQVERVCLKNTKTHNEKKSLEDSGRLCFPPTLIATLRGLCYKSSLKATQVTA